MSFAFWELHKIHNYMERILLILLSFTQCLFLDLLHCCGEQFLVNISSPVAVNSSRAANRPGCFFSTAGISVDVCHITWLLSSIILQILRNSGKFLLCGSRMYRYSWVCCEDDMLNALFWKYQIFIKLCMRIKGILGRKQLVSYLSQDNPFYYIMNEWAFIFSID